MKINCKAWSSSDWQVWTLSRVALAITVVLALTLCAETSIAQSFVRKFNFGTVYKTAPSKSERVTAKNALPTLSYRSVSTMYDALSRYEIIVSRGGWPSISVQRPLVLGTKSGVVRNLRRRLEIEGYLRPTRHDPKKFDQALQRAVSRFQSRHGLPITGKVDRQTVAVLNVPASVRLRQLRENLPRILEYSKDLGPRYVIVNIPAAQLESVSHDRVYSRHNVVVGKPARPSPVLSSSINKLNFNPYWHAPVSIVAKDILPKVRKNVRWLDTMRIKVFDGHNGPEVNPRTINWTRVAPDRYHFRQEPGGENAMASVKINFPNKYSVYLHDTPTKGLFERAARFFSSGCVRVDKVHLLTEWLLQGQSGWDRRRIRHVAQTERPTDVDLYNPAQLRMVYLTAWALPDGSVHFRADIYRLDGTGFVSGQPRPTGAQAAAEARVYQPQPSESRPATAVDSGVQATTILNTDRNVPVITQPSPNNFSTSAARARRGGREVKQPRW